jgi:large subunit ribosomal protein L13
MTVAEEVSTRRAPHPAEFLDDRPYIVVSFGFAVIRRGAQERVGQGLIRMRTYVATPKTITSRWHVIDAQGQSLGRVATVAAKLLQGKHKATYTPFIDTGDHVVIVNAAAVKLTGRKEEQKMYRHHSGYPGGLREERAAVVRQRRPERLLEEGVRGMLPKTKLGDAMFRKLKVYAGKDHPHAAQQPIVYEVA